MSAHHVGVGIHPLDWACYLRQFLVSDSVPTFLTLLLVSAHFYSCCEPEIRQASVPSGENASATSFTGAVFQGVADLVQASSQCSIRTPLHYSWGSRGPNQTAGGSRQDEGQQQATRDLKDAILSAAMTDPMSMLFDMVWYLSAADIQIPAKTGNVLEDEANPQENASCHSNSSEPHEQESGTFSESSQESMWSIVCAVHFVGLTAIAIPLIPSIFKTSMLQCNSLSREVNMTVWPVLNSCVLVVGLSLVSCCVLHYVAGMHELALLVSMHSSCQIVVAYMCMCSSCPLPPVFMPSLAASGMGAGIAVLLLVVAHAQSLASCKEDFYMLHAWACCVGLLVMRHTLFRAALYPFSSVNRANINQLAAGSSNYEEHED